MKRVTGKWLLFVVALLALFVPSSGWAQLTNAPATDIAAAVSSGVTIFNSVYAIVIASVVLGFLLWVVGAARRRR